MTTRRRSASASQIAALAAVAAVALIVLAAIAWPLLALVAKSSGVVAATASRDGRGVGLTLGAGELSTPLALFTRSVAYAACAALAGLAVAWPASRAVRMRASANRALAGLILLPIALPPWLLYAALWMSMGPGTAVGDFCERRDLVSALRVVLLAIALLVWCAAASFAVLSCAAPRAIATDARLLALDGAGVLARVRSALARDARSLLVAGVACAVFLLGETTVFDLAQVATYGFELRTLDAIGGTPRDIVLASLPVVALVAVAIALVPRIARSAGDDALRARGASGRGPSAAAAAAASRLPANAVLVACALPIVGVLLALARVIVSVPRMSDFVALHGRAFMSTLGVALSAAALVALLAAGIRALLAARALWLCRAARVAALACAFGGLIPGTISALSMESAYNSALFAWIYDTPMVVVLVLVARAAPVAAIVALALDAREHRTARWLREIDGASVAAIWRGIRGELAIAAAASGALAFAWSLGELTASGRVVPPGMAWLATDILNSVHYQRPDTVILAASALVVAALPAVLALGRFVSRMQVARVAALTLSATLAATLSATLLTLAPGCSDAAPAAASDSETDREMDALRRTAPSVATPLAVESQFAGVGRGKGQFVGPRVVAFDNGDGSTFVIDKDARVQRIMRDGEVRNEWRMPKWDRGKPVGASIAPDGSLVVADTHEHRILCYDAQGKRLWELGSYGLEPGQFVYPTDIAFAPDGRMFIAEYGGNDRIQVFGPDRRFLYAFGRCGIGDGEFLRPQSIAFDAERDELYVADAGNHRIQVFTADGEHRRNIGRLGSGPGSAPGEFSYPFGLVLEIGGRAIDSRAAGECSDPALARDGRRTIVVAEHANHRVQRLDANTGEVLAIAGGLGNEQGRLKYPWALEPAGLAADGSQRYAVCDNGNSRIVFFTLPDGSRK